LFAGVSRFHCRECSDNRARIANEISLEHDDICEKYQHIASLRLANASEAAGGLGL
jgi:hypothetical protein